jgi:hypothetical protein
MMTSNDWNFFLKGFLIGAITAAFLTHFSWLSAKPWNNGYNAGKRAAETDTISLYTSAYQKGFDDAFSLKGSKRHGK